MDGCPNYNFPKRGEPAAALHPFNLPPAHPTPDITTRKSKFIHEFKAHHQTYL